MTYNDNKNDRFRDNIVPYISEIVHYQNEADIFNIVMPCGVSYYICDKHKHNDKFVTSKSNVIPCFNSDRVLYKDFDCNDSLLYAGHNIIKKLGKFTKFKNIVDGDFKVFATKALRGFYLGGSDTHVYTATPVIKEVIVFILWSI
jgi:hypothetical protein